MKKAFVSSSIISILTFPGFLFAFSLASSTFKDVIDEILTIIALLIPILLSLAFLVFFWGLSKFILHSDSKGDVEKGRNYMMWGVIALFILITFRVIIGLIVSDLGWGSVSITPQFPTS